MNLAREAREAPQRRWIRLVTLAVLGAIAGDLVLLAINLTSPRAGLSGVQGDARLVVPLHAATFIMLGALVASRLPKNPVGWILWAGGIWSTVQSLMTEYAWTALRTGPLPGAATAGSLESGLGPPIFLITLTYLVMFFPDGRLASSRWRPAAVISGLILALVLTVATVASLSWSDFRNPPPIPIAFFIAIGLALVPIATAITSLVVKYRRSANEQRQQIKWLAYAAVVTAVCILTIPPVGSLLIPAQNSAQLSLVAVIPIGSTLLLPIAMAIAILRYRLYDIDLVINRTVAYGALAVVITLLYVAVVVGVGSLIGRGARADFVLSLVATALVAVGFQPIRQRAQRFANRLVYGDRATPYEVLSRFSERIAQTVASDDTLRQMAEVLANGTGASRAEVWVRSGTAWRCAAAYPESVEPGIVLQLSENELPQVGSGGAVMPVRYQGDLLGAIAVAKAKRQPLLPIEEKLLSDLAQQAGLVLRNVGLSADLRQRLEELRASRQRLVSAQDAERRRLERNIHDGAQQTLVALKVKLALARQTWKKDPARMETLLTELSADADESLTTLRELARGIYPPLLADQGLAAALKAQALRSPIPVELSTDGAGRYRADLEAAIYFCCLEGLQNAAKYSGASKVTICLAQENGELVFAVEDNGRGYDMAHVKAGAGLQNMTDRVEALGGHLEIRSAPRAGTVVTGRFPVETMSGASTESL